MKKIDRGTDGIHLPVADSGTIGRRDLLKASSLIAMTLPFAFATTSPWKAFADSAPAETPKSGGSAVFVISADPVTSNQNTTTSAPDHEVAGLIYEGLTRISGDFAAEPSLAKSWEISPDGLRYTFKLVEANWHDGKPFTSSDVKFTLENVSKPYSARFAPAAAAIKEISTPDDRTVVIELSKSFGPLLFSLSPYSGAAMMPEHVFKDTDILKNRALIDQPIGTGPFKMAEWLPGDRVVVKKNQDYWQPGKPYLDQITQKVIPDPNTRVLSLKAGEVDYCNYYYYPPSRIQEAKDDPRLQTREKAIPQDKHLIFNTRQAPFNDVKVRQALFRATNRAYIEHVVYHDLGQIMKNHMDSHIPWAHDPAIDLDKLYPYDVAAANALLDEAGVKADSTGHRFDVRLSFDSTDEDWGRMAQVLTAMWAQVGVKVVLQGNPRNVMLDQVFKNWDFDATLQAYSTAGDPALGVSRLYISSAIDKRPFLNVSGYSNPDVDSLFEAGATAADNAARGDAYKKVSAILARDVAVMPLWETATINVASVDLRGKWAWSTGNSHWEDVWLAR